MTVSGDTMGERLAADTGWVDRNVVRSLAEPYLKQGGLAALFGTLAPNGAIIKRSAADPKLFEREGRAVVFESLDDLAARIDSPDLDVTAEDFLVLQNAGPKSGYAMPEAGYLPIPMKLSRAGVKDMVRISDARMSGTAFGTVVLHVSPESAIGGPLALVRSGDRIRLSVSRANSTCWWTRRNWPGAAARTARLRLQPNAAMPSCISTACCRPNRAAISISCEKSEQGVFPRPAYGERARVRGKLGSPCAIPNNRMRGQHAPLQLKRKLEK
jgi:dihydroxyacid dehydratase/phosphogluconate dehydratase